MDDKWSYIDFNSLIKEILNGKRCIQEPIVVNNSSGEKARNIPFKEHLLCYENIHEDNLLEILHKMYMMFNTRVDQLNENENVREMIKQVNGEWFQEEESLKVNGEWFQEDESLKLNDPLDSEFFETCQKDKRTYEKSKKKFDEMIKLSNYEKDIPIDSKLREDYPMERELEGAILLCNKSIENITTTANSLKQIINTIRTANTSTIIELSTKHRPLYSSSSSSEDKTLPINIHKIFSNYLHIYNLFLKQLIIYHNKIVDMIKDMEKKCSELQILKQNVNIIAHLDVDDDDLFDIVFNGIKSIFYTEDENEKNLEEGILKEEIPVENKIQMLIQDDEGDEQEVDREDDLLTYGINKLDDVNEAVTVSKKLKEFF
jgi:hypothetical protein